MSIVAAVDLRAIFGAARDQGSRPTCCAFACSDLHAASRKPWNPLSCEYAFFHGVRRQGTTPATGVFLHHMLDVIQHDGQPCEAAWPYQSTLPADLSQWSPPPDVGELFRASAAAAGNDVQAVKTGIAQGHPVLLIMSISDAFYSPDVRGVVDSSEAADVSRIHALIAVGVGTNGSESYLLVRNSWGQGWGIAGHAWLSEGYVSSRLIHQATILTVTA